MSKKTKTIIIIAVAACAVIAGIVTAIIFREDIKKCFSGLVEKLSPKKKYTEEECEDFADIYLDAQTINSSCKREWDDEQKAWSNEHKWKKTGKTRPGRFFGDSWPDVEMTCTKCGLTGWTLFDE